MNISVKSLEDDRIILLLKGSFVNHSTINTLRRVIMSEIPTYGISEDNIKIEKNTSIFNNDQIRLRLSMIPLPNLSNDLSIYHKDGDYKMDKLELYVNTENKSDKILNVTTNDLTIYKNDKQIDNIFSLNSPDLLIKLRPNEEFKCKVTATLGKASLNDLWSAVSVCYFKQLKEDEYEFIFETLGQLSHKDILQKACQIIVKKIENIEILVGNKYKNSLLDKTKKVMLNIQNENHTMGNLLGYMLKLDKNVVYAGFRKDHLLIDNIEIKLETTNYNPVKTFFMVTDELKKNYRLLEKKIVGLKYKNKL
jgi:DNA-directed RNA polymerase subunit L